LNPWLALAAILAIGGAWIGGELQGGRDADARWASRIERERADASEEARRIERTQQEAANHALRRQHQDQVAIAARLRRELDGLRNRPERPRDLPDTTIAACQGATGAELSRLDAEFLAREAARADEQRAGLMACYATLDGLVQ
jgi:hypothetical protein